MRKIQLLLIMALIAFAGCGKDNFFDKYPPEVLFYQDADVVNADFNAIILATGVNQFIVKARVSAPYKLKEIKIYSSVDGFTTNTLLNTFSDFTLTPNVIKVSSTLTNITVATVVKIVATDMNNHVTTKLFNITVTP